MLRYFIETKGLIQPETTGFKPVLRGQYIQFLNCGIQLPAGTVEAFGRDFRI